MKKRLKITEGKADVVSYSNGSELVGFVNIENAKSIISITNPFDNKFFDAQLIADAFNTANETQLLPSELKEQRDELLGVLKGLVSDVGNLLGEHDFEWQQAGYFNAAQELINKIKDNE